MATLITMALTGHSAENRESPESTPKPARMGWRRTNDGGGAGAGAAVERSSVMGM
jgi:hypothetical protein